MTITLPDAMRRFCIKCQREIDVRRVLRGSVTCSTACYNADRKARRAYHRARFCETCGRGRKVQKSPQSVPGESEPVREAGEASSAHS